MNDGYRKYGLYAGWDELLFFLFAIFWFIVSLYYNTSTNEIQGAEKIMYVLSVICTIHLLLSLLSIRRMQGGRIFSPYFIVFMFLYIFSFGQFLMWTFGIHYIAEMTVSRHVRFIDSSTVVRIQIISLELVSIFHWAVLMVARKYDYRINKRIEKNSTLAWLKILSIPMLIVSWIINVYYSVVGFRQAAISGYAALFEQNVPALIKYLSYMFVPAVFLVIITHNYSKKWFYILTVMFGMYALPLMIAGDRGSWIYFLCAWLWIYIRFVNTPEGDDDKTCRRRAILSVVLVIALLFVSSIFVSVRGEGYTNLQKTNISFEDLYTPFVKPFFEMGQSARILGIEIQDGLDKTYHYGNTYIADVLGMVLPRIKVFFGFPDWYVENWMSSQYLNMVNYGVGFSAFGEAYLNGGVFFSWFYMLLYGVFLGRLTLIKNEDVHIYPIKAYLALSAVAMLGPSVRATMDLWLREFFWGTLVVLIIAKILSSTREW